MLKSGDYLHLSLHVVWSFNEEVGFSLIFFTDPVLINLCLSTDEKLAVKKYVPHAHTHFQKTKDQKHIYFFTSPK